MANDARDTLAVIPWYWRDWRASKARAVLISDPAALLAYRELLDALWGEENCSLPADDESLAALAGVTAEVWARVKDRVLRFLPADEDGRRSHPRARHEWQKAILYREGCRAGGRNRAESLTPERRSEIAKTAATARWMHGEQAGNARSMLADACTPSPSASASPTPNEEEIRKQSVATVAATAPAAPVSDPILVLIRSQSIPAWDRDQRLTAAWAESVRRANPTLDFAAEIAKAATWWASNPARTRGKSAISRFLGSWFSRAAERGPTNGHAKSWQEKSDERVHDLVAFFDKPKGDQP